MPDTAEEFLPEKAVVTVDRVVGLCHLGVWLELDTVVSPEGVIGLPRATDTGDKGL